MTVLATVPDGTDERQAYAVRVDGMSCWNGGVRAVHNLTLRIPTGSIYALLGLRGSGKTTVLRALATLQPASGSVLVAGIDVGADPRSVRSRIGYLQDAPGMNEGLTVEEYLDFHASIYRVPARRRPHLISELLELVDLIDQRARPIGSLSRSMRQHLGLARCLVHDPEILLLDDPFSHLDARARIELHDLLRELSNLNKTVIVSTRAPADISQACTHAGVLDGGHLVAEGPIGDIYSLPTAARLHVALLDAGSRREAMQFLQDHPLCGAVEEEGQRGMLVYLAGSERDLPALVEDLVTAHIGLIEFTLDRDPLTAMLLQLPEGRGER